MRQVIARGKKVDDAVAAGCAELGVSKEEVEIQILVLPGWFRKAEVKLTVIGDETEEPAPAEKPRDEFRKSRDEFRKPRQDKRPREKRETDSDKKPTEDTRPKPTFKPREIRPVDPAAAELAAKYVDELLPKMGIEGTATAVIEEGEVVVTIATEDAAVIGHRGETLDAINVLAKRAAEKSGDKYVRVVVDALGYRDKRTDSLVRLAHKTAEKCLRTGRKITLEPMTSDQRKIIHAALGDNDKVITRSEGRDPERRVAIMPKRDGHGKGGKPRYPRRERTVEQPSEQAAQPDENSTEQSAE